MGTERSDGVEATRNASYRDQANYSADRWANTSPPSQDSYDSSPLNGHASYSGYGPQHMYPDSFQTLASLPQNSKSPPMSMANLNQRHLAESNSSAWPSQLITSTAYPPLRSAAPVPVVVSESPTDDSKSEKEKRKTVSSEKKRAMCLYAEQNPGMRQADIGAKFGVERSTVSKVLRRKEHHLRAEPEDTANKKLRSRHPDFERTLSNYVQRRVQQGFQLSDEEIMDQAKVFARASSNTEVIMACLTEVWLLKFKQRHGFKTGRLWRRASETNIPDKSPRYQHNNKMRSRGRSSFALPLVPTQQTLSSSRSDEDLRTDASHFDFSYRQEASQSVSSLASDIRDNPQSSFSSEEYSPTTAFTFSPDANNGGYPFDPNMQMPLEYRDPNQLAPGIARTIDYKHPGPRPESITPRQTASSTIDTTRLVPIPSAPPQDPGMLSPGVRRAGPDVTPRYAHNAVTGNLVAVMPVDEAMMPSEDDVRHAANTLLQYLTSGVAKVPFDEHEYHAFVELTKRLQMEQPMHHISLSQIPEAEYESTSHFN